MKLTTLFLCANDSGPCNHFVFATPATGQQASRRHTRNVLRGAYGDLEKAGGEWGGHRGKAMEHIKAALSELDQAEAWAKEHHDIK